MTNVSRQQAAPAAPCTHQWEHLGTDRDLQFVLCRPCGKVFLQQGGLLASVPVAGAQNDATDEGDRLARAAGE